MAPVSQLRSFGVALPAIFLFWALSAFLWWDQARKIGILSYALDDPYIHLALSKNWAWHGVWGITRHEFTSASSSPLWTALLAIPFVFSGNPNGAPLYFPAVLEFLIGATLLWVFVRWLLASKVAPAWAIFWSAVLVLVAPLPTLAVSGQEHLLHALLLLLLLSQISTVLVLRKQPSWSFWLLVTLLVLTRYESLFVLFWLGIAFLWQRRWREAMLVAVFSLTPLALFGAVSMHYGWPPIPNSIYLKARATTDGTGPEFVSRLLTVLQTDTACLALLLLLTISLLWAFRVKSKDAIAVLALCLAATVFHFSLARVGWLLRYEAYLVIGALVPIVALWHNVSSARFSFLARQFHWVLAILVAVGFSSRVFQASQITPRALRNIALQHVLTGRFLAEQLPQSSVVLNDVGAISYFNDGKIVDYFGLTNIEVTRARRENRDSPAFFQKAIAQHGGQFAAMVDWHGTAPTRFENPTARGDFPSNWFLVSSWQLPTRDVQFYETLEWWAIGRENIAPLRAALQKFSPQIPPRVKVRWAKN